MSLVAVEDVVVAVGGKSILDGISLTVEPGETVGIIGPNGAGKTTLLRVIAGDQTPTTGRVVLCGDPVDTLPLPELARRRAFLASETPTDVLFTVRDVVGFSAGTPTATTAALHTADVADIVDRIFASLSTGERQRVGIARVVAQAADVMLLDEPTASLDLGRREQVMEALHSYAATGARAVVAAIHDVNLAAAHTDRLVVLDEGRVVAFGTPRDVLTADTLTAIYRQPLRVIDHPERDCPMVVTVDQSAPKPPSEPS